ncbi:MaoC/PaaZ C-terminal domain-containing protein [Salinisphaera aquimarina]|uniref:MaoC/PaaZ C-terminal domain-containing protein n=1 Tax=Salinisphaera aquimarina TaxID=2094031 RepID=A0ABV7ETJ4_9GAMM
MTGDRSSLHTDGAFARRSRFRERVAHGKLTVASLAALMSLSREHRQVRFESLKGHFREPIRPRDRLLLRLAVRSHGYVGEFNATWTHDGHAKELAVATGRYRLTAPADQSLTGLGLLSTPRFEELDLDLDALGGRTETIGFATDPRLLKQIESKLLIPMGLTPGCSVSPELLAALMLSPLVGMRLPGHRTVFLSFASRVQQTRRL